MKVTRLLSIACSLVIAGLLGFSFFLSLNVQPTQAANRNVCAACTYTTIQAAVNATAPGDVIRVAAGVYTENLVITKSVTLEGGWDTGFTTRVPKTTVVDAAGGPGSGFVILGQGIVVTVDGFEIKNATNSGINASVAELSQVYLRNNWLHDNSSLHAGGIYLNANESSVFEVSDTQFTTNTSASAGGLKAIVSQGSSITLARNLFRSNDGTDAGGLYLSLYIGAASVTGQQILNNTSLDGPGGMRIDTQNFSAVTGGGLVVENNVSTNSSGGMLINNTDGSSIDIPGADGSGLHLENNRGNDYGGMVAGNINNSRIDLSGMQVISNTGHDIGGVFSINLFNSQLDLSGLQVISNTGTMQGGVMIHSMTGGKIDLEGSVFERNRAMAGNGGGLVLLSNSNQSVNIANTRFLTNTAALNGGGLFLINTFSPLISGDHTFISNTAASGGGMFVPVCQNCLLDLSNSVFERNTAISDNGGGLDIANADQSSSLILDNVRFIRNSSVNQGGGASIFVASRTKLHIAGSTFDDNITNMSGGGLAFNSITQGELTLDGNTFTGNEAMVGGGIYAGMISSSKVTIRDNVIAQNTSSMGYPGCYFTGFQANGLVTFEGNEISNNSSILGSSCVIFQAMGPGDFDFVGNRIMDNTSMIDGAGLYVAGIGSIAHMRFWDNVISGNISGITGTLVTGGNNAGLMLFVNDPTSSVDMQRNQIVDNQALINGPMGGIGAGLNLQTGGQVTMRDNLIQGNQAGFARAGMMANIPPGGRLEMGGNVIQNNTAVTDTAGLYISGAGIARYELVGNQVVGNHSLDNSGVFLDHADASPRGTSENNLIAGNDHGISLYNASFSSRNDTIANNGSYGIRIDGSGAFSLTATLANTIVWGHTTAYSETAAHAHDYNLIATYSDIQGGAPGTGNLDADPLFVASGNYRLQSASPAIDQVPAGSAPSADLMGVPRPVPAGGLADMGAFEWHQAGVSLSPDQANECTPGLQTNFHLTITNTGSIPETFLFDLPANSLDWSASIQPASLTLAPGASGFTDVFFTCPAGALAGLLNQATLRATSSLDGAVLDVAALDVTVAKVAALTLSLEQGAGLAPGAANYLFHTLTNNGNFADTISLSATSAQGWLAGVQPPAVTLAPGETTLVTVTVRLPAYVPAFTAYSTLLTATSSSPYGEPVATATDTGSVLRVAGVTLSAGCSANAGAGASTRYSHTVTNTGNYTDTFSLSAVSGSGWSLQVTPATLTLAPGQSGTFEAVMLVPASAGVVDETVTVRAASTYNTAVTATATDTAEVGRRIFIPIVGK